MTVTVIDYGLGNVAAFLEIYKRNDVPARRAANAAELEGATKLILPGVGAFDHAMTLLDRSGMRGRVDEMVGAGTPVLGVCVGMQIMAGGSEEGSLPGLGWVDAHVRKLGVANTNRPLPCPHMGWNNVYQTQSGGLFDGLDHGTRFYFLHSYYVECRDPEDIIATCSYGQDFSCGFRRGNVYGVQFHPEKGHDWGTRLLLNYARA